MLFKMILAVLAVLAISITGCPPGNEPIERATDRGFDTVNKFVDKGVSELSTRTAQLQGSLTGVNPGYHISGYGCFGPAFIFDLRVNVDGVSGTLMGATQADQGEALPDTRPPGNRTPATRPPDTRALEI